MKSRVYMLVCAAACCFLSGRAEEAQPVWRVVALRPAASAAADVPLPPLAEVASTDASGQTWQQSGEIGGSLEAALQEFAVSLRAAGWGLDKTIMLGGLSARSGLTVWIRRRQRVLLMLWEKEAGKCGFALGRE